MQKKPLPVISLKDGAPSVQELQRLVLRLCHCGSHKRSFADVSNWSKEGRIVVAMLPYVSETLLVADTMPFLGELIHTPKRRKTAMRKGTIANDFNCSLVQELLTVTSDDTKSSTKKPAWDGPNYGKKMGVEYYLVTHEEARQHDFPLLGERDTLKAGWVSFGCPQFGQTQRNESLNETIDTEGWSKKKRKKNTRITGTDPLVNHLIAMDCEMVETEAGDEVARVSLVDDSLNVLMDEYVVPEYPVKDYRTKWSGIKASTLNGVTTTLSDIQSKLGDIITPSSIIVGHSVDNDMRALKIVHGRVIDTSIVFPHPRPPNKHSLKTLANRYLDGNFRVRLNKKNGVRRNGQKNASLERQSLVSLQNPQSSQSCSDVNTRNDASERMERGGGEGGDSEAGTEEESGGKSDKHVMVNEDARMGSCDDDEEISRGKMTERDKDNDKAKTMMAVDSCADFPPPVLSDPKDNNNALQIDDSDNNHNNNCTDNSCIINKNIEVRDHMNDNNKHNNKLPNGEDEDCDDYDDEGHSSVEDGRAAMKLCLRKVELGVNFGGVLVPHPPRSLGDVVADGYRKKRMIESEEQDEGGQEKDEGEEDNEGVKQESNDAGGRQRARPEDANEKGEEGCCHGTAEDLVAVIDTEYHRTDTFIGKSSFGSTAVYHRPSDTSVCELAVRILSTKPASMFHPENDQGEVSERENDTSSTKTPTPTSRPPPPNVMVVVLRDFQRMCSRRTGMDTIRDFKTPLQKLLERGKRILSPLYREAAAPSSRDAHTTPSLWEKIEVAMKEVTEQTFCPVAPMESKKVLESMDSSLRQIFANLRRGDLMIVYSPCGDGARYLSLQHARKVLTTPHIMTQTTVGGEIECVNDVESLEKIAKGRLDDESGMGGAMQVDGEEDNTEGKGEKRSKSVEDREGSVHESTDVPYCHVTFTSEMESSRQRALGDFQKAWASFLVKN